MIERKTEDRRPWTEVEEQSESIPHLREPKTDNRGTEALDLRVRDQEYFFLFEREPDLICYSRIYICGITDKNDQDANNC